MRGGSSSKAPRWAGAAWAALGFVGVYKFQMSPLAVTKGSVGFRPQAPLLTLYLHHRV